MPKGIGYPGKRLAKPGSTSVVVTKKRKFVNPNQDKPLVEMSAAERKKLIDKSIAALANKKPSVSSTRARRVSR